MTVEQLRAELASLENDILLLPAEVMNAKIAVLGDAFARPVNVGQAKQLIAELRRTLHETTTEVPL